MAQFLKVKTLAAGAPEVLIPISNIGGMIATNVGATTLLTITMRTGRAAAAPSGTYVITVAQPFGTANQRLAAMSKAFNDALAANPGGIISTVMPPLTSAQVTIPASPGAQGRVVVTAPAVYTQFTSCVFTV